MKTLKQVEEWNWFTENISLRNKCCNWTF